MLKLTDEERIHIAALVDSGYNIQTREHWVYRNQLGQMQIIRNREIGNRELTWTYVSMSADAILTELMSIEKFNEIALTSPRRP